jgi:glycosyltransferase involved in cell wall biosynthesis
MRIAVASRAVEPLHGWGGLERAVDDLCTSLTSSGHDVTLFTADGVLRADTRQPRYGLVTVPWERGFPLRRGSVLDRRVNYSRFIRRITATIAASDMKFDAAIGHGAATAALAPLRTDRHIGRLVLNPHGMEEFSAPGLKGSALGFQRALVREAARHADVVIALDARLVSDVQRNLCIAPQRIAIVPNGIDLARIGALCRGMDTGDREPPTIVSVARIEANKGLDVLAAALAANRDRLPAGWMWRHIGDGAARRALERGVARAGIAAHVELCGRLSEEELHRHLEHATLFVHPTRYEGSPLAILEAMAHRLPVIASAVGGIPDTIISGQTGWLIPPGNPRALGAAIVAALALPVSARHTMGRRARTLVSEEFSLPRIADRWLAVLEGAPLVV